jgi:hypothetical protein
MIKAVATNGKTGRAILVLGLSFGNLKKFRDEPRDTHIKIDGAAMGLPLDVMIFSAENDSALAAFMSEFIGPDTKLHIDPRLRS